MKLTDLNEARYAESQYVKLVRTLIDNLLQTHNYDPGTSALGLTTTQLIPLAERQNVVDQLTTAFNQKPERYTKFEDRWFIRHGERDLRISAGEVPNKKVNIVAYIRPGSR